MGFNSGFKGLNTSAATQVAVAIFNTEVSFLPINNSSCVCIWQYGISTHRTQCQSLQDTSKTQRPNPLRTVLYILPNKKYIDTPIEASTDKLSIIISNLYTSNYRSQWPCVLRRRSAAARLLRSWVRIPPGAWMFVCCECCVLSGRGHREELITRPEESY